MKARPRIIIILVCCVLGVVGAVIYGTMTETQKGEARDLEQLRDAAARLQVMAGFAQSSKMWSFPYDYPAGWTRMKIRPQFHWHGKGVLKEIEPFLSGLGSPVIRHMNDSGEKTKATFVLVEGKVAAEDEINLTDGSFSFQVMHLERAEPDGAANRQ